MYWLFSTTRFCFQFTITLIFIQKSLSLTQNLWTNTCTHPNCVLFITHGGLFGQQDANYAGIPTVGIPYFGDQFFNVKLNEHQGTGVKLDYKTLSEESVSSAINMVINNSKFKENAMKMSRIYRDMPISAADSAVFWVEYVLRHDGAHHLRPAATKLFWYQLVLLDVIGVILTAIITVLVTIFIIIRKILTCMCVNKQIKVPT